MSFHPILREYVKPLVPGTLFELASGYLQALVVVNPKRQLTKSSLSERCDTT